MGRGTLTGNSMGRRNLRNSQGSSFNVDLHPLGRSSPWASLFVCSAIRLDPALPRRTLERRRARAPRGRRNFPIAHKPLKFNEIAQNLDVKISKNFLLPLDPGAVQDGGPESRDGPGTGEAARARMMRAAPN